MPSLLAAVLLALSTIISSPVAKSSGIPHLRHVVVIVLENRSFSPSHDTPYMRSLVHRGALLTSYYAIQHPSLPNYLALISGHTYGVTTDGYSGTLQEPTIVDGLEARGLSWRAYIAGMPAPCYRGVATGRYVKRHNPFMYFGGVTGNRTRCARVQPYTSFLSYLAHGKLPAFTWITPDLCDDGHDCPDSSVDAWMAANVPPILSSRAFKDRGVLFVTHDEADRTSSSGCCAGLAFGGQVETIAVGYHIHPGIKVSEPADHYSLLGTIEKALRLPLIGHAGCPCNPPLAGLWTR